MNRQLPSFILDLNRLAPEERPRVDTHMHTNWTDGRDDVPAMYEKACAVGLDHIVFSEHARRTSGDWFKDFATQVRQLPQTPCKAWVGVETRISDQQGNIDIGADIIDCCDIVVASVHRFPDKDGNALPFDSIDPDRALDIEFNLALSLLDNPAIHVLGHPFGMCYAKYKMKPTDAMLEKLIAKAAATGVVFEVNAKYHPDPTKIIGLCKKAGAFFSLGSDAHSTEELGRITIA